MTWEQAFAAGSVIIAAAVAWWGHRRGQKSDEVSKQSGMATETRAGTQQIIDGLNALVDQLQESDQVKHATIVYLESRLTAVAKELEEAKLELSRLRRKYGEDGS